MTRRASDRSIEPQLLRSGNYQDICPDCGTTTVAGTLEDVLGAACACQARRAYRYLVELVCTLCSRVVAIAVIDQPGAPIRIPRQVRCQRHEYDHTDGYVGHAALTVQAVCTQCHHRRGRERGTHVRPHGPNGRFISRG